MSLKTLIVGVLAAVGLLVAAVIVGRILVGIAPAEYKPTRLSEEELLRAEERLIRTEADLLTAVQQAEPFILELSLEQIREMLEVVVRRHNVLPKNITAPYISLGHDTIWAYALVSWKGQQSVASIRIRPFVDSAGLLHVELEGLKAGALGLPESFVPETLDKLEKSLSVQLATSSSTSDAATVAKKNPDILTRIFTALHGVPVPTKFSTREDLQMSIEEIRISPEAMEIRFRPLPQDETSPPDS